jgi:catechol 2,3-dioxygenase-like lactoylglutathione lyase family enzyme
MESVGLRLEAVHPVLMCRDVTASIQFYERLGFSLAFQDRDADPKYAAIVRDQVELHLQWHDKSNWAYPIDRPTYRFLADPDKLFDEFKHRGVVAQSSVNPGAFYIPTDTAWGTREFHVRDPDGNGLQFYRIR